LRFLDVLKFVEEDDENCPGCFGSVSDLLEQRTQVPFEIPVVGEAGFRIVIEANFDIAVGSFSLLAKPASAFSTRTTLSFAASTRFKRSNAKRS
jgi:hypothetical protein